MFSTKKHFENLIFFDIEIAECLNDANSKTLSNEDGSLTFYCKWTQCEVANGFESTGSVPERVYQ